MRLTKLLNPSTKIMNLLVDNDNFLKRIINQTILLIHSKYHNINYQYVYDLQIVNGERGSIQHGSALDFASHFIQTEYVIVRDPDCILLIHNWILNLKHILENNDFQLIGTPEAKTDTNMDIWEGPYSYKFNSPLPFFLYGRNHIIFSESFAPSKLSHFRLDTGYKLAHRCLNNSFTYDLFVAISTRNTNLDSIHFKQFDCALYEYSKLADALVAVHYGRGSNPLGKNRNTASTLLRIWKSFAEPLLFRKHILDYVRFENNTR